MSRAKAYSYIRMSTDMQLKGDSLRRQLAASQKYAAEHDLELVEDFLPADIGVSAFKGANVTTGALGRFLAAVRDGQIEPGSYLLVESLDRITRQKLLQAQALFLEIVNSGINIVTLADGHVYRAGSNDLGDFIISLVSMARANEESELKSQRVAAAWSNKRANAGHRKLTAMCPAWLRLIGERERYEAIPERAAVVRAIFEDCVAGIGNYTITKRLNEKRVPTFNDRSEGWQKSYVAKILNNPAVLGHFQPHKLDPDRKRVPDGPIITDYFPAVIEEELFYRAQAARAERDVGSGGMGAGRKGKQLANLFSHLLHCEYCDRKLLIENKGPKPKGGTYLVCDGVKRGLGCTNKRWRYDEFEASFLAFVRELDLERILSSDVNAEKRADLDQQIASLEGELHAKRTEQEKAYALFQAADQSPFVAKKIAENDARIADLTRQLDDKHTEREKLAAATTQVYESKIQIKSLLNRFKQPDHNEDIYKLRSQIASRLRGIVEKIFVAGSGSVPHIKLGIAKLTKQRPLPTKMIARYQREVRRSAANRRFFTVVFKDRMVRHVVPYSSDPLRFISQDFGSLDALKHIRTEMVLAQSKPQAAILAALKSAAEGPNTSARRKHT